MKTRRIAISLLLALTLIMQSLVALPVFAADDESKAAPAATVTEEIVEKPAAPVIKVTSKYNNKADISWKKVPGAAGYEIWRSVKKNDKWVNKRIKTLNKTKYRNTGLKTNKTYKYKVRAYTIVEGKKVYSPYSEKVKIKAKKRAPKVLIVDNSSLATPVANKLRNAGCEVTKVYSLSKVKTSKYDALVIPGGGDINAKYYGQSNNPNNYGINNTKDYIQIESVKRFAKAGKPVLGICRGCQVINVALGGTLEQHISGYHLFNRTVSIKKGSWLYDVYGSSKSVYHYHHQCVKKLGKNLKATQWDARDGRIEGIEHKKLPIYGLQWHPEMVTRNGSKVFTSFKKVIMKQLAE